MIQLLEAVSSASVASERTIALIMQINPKEA
jgi:hypothetical protein